MTKPILYSFRRCPYAMRARLAIASAGITTELREIVLRDKAPEFTLASPKATVPILLLADQTLEESLDIMIWALSQNDPEGWLKMPDHDLIKEADGPFKEALDRTKYATRYEDADPDTERQKANSFLGKITAHLTPYLGGAKPNLTDISILPFVRQFANIDRPRFDADHEPRLISWLDEFLTSDRFQAIMSKYPKWKAGDPPTFFPAS
ncbi:MAG: glutathione S-transferase [Mariniblastus sp.]